MTNEEFVMKIKAGEDVQQNMALLYEQTKNFIRKIAWKYRQNDELEDLLQEGFLSLYDAVEGYDPEAGFSFISYAAFYLKTRFARYLADKGSCVQIPIHRLEDIRKYQRFCSAYFLEHGCEPSAKSVSQFMHISIEQVEQIKQNACMARLGSLDKPIKENEDETTVGDLIGDPNNHIEDAEERLQNDHLKTILWDCVDDLPEKQAETIKARYFEGLTLQETGERLGTNKEGARQMEAKGLRELRRPSRAKRLRPFYEDVERIRSMGMTGTGVEIFERTWTSATERVAMRHFGG